MVTHTTARPDPLPMGRARAAHSHQGGTMTKPDVQVRPFADFIRETNRGTTHDELSEYLQQLTAAVSDTGKKGRLILTIEVAPMGDAFQVSNNISLQRPARTRGASTYVAPADHSRVRTGPRQRQFESLAEVPPPPGVDL